jgi:excisionase family DNA binding protein
VSTTIESPVLGAGETARRLGISAQYLSQLAKAGRIPFTLTPYGRTYREIDVDRLRAVRKRGEQ